MSLKIVPLSRGNAHFRQVHMVSTSGRARELTLKVANLILSGSSIM